MTSLAVLFLAASNVHNLPDGLLSAICYVESHHDTKAMHYDDGKHTSIGICQLQLPTAHFLGFKGTSIAQLRRPDINIDLAGRYLAYQLRRHNGSVYKAIASYNSGSYIVNDKGQAINRRYVDKVYKEWKKTR